MPGVIHFEIPADNPDRAVEFYKQVFGWKFDKWPGPHDYWLITTGKESQASMAGCCSAPIPVLVRLTLSV